MITATGAGILSASFMGPILGSPDYLVKISANEIHVITGALFTLIMGFAGAGISISLYPILRRHNEGLAIGSVSFRIIEGMLWTINAIGLLLLLTLSQESGKAGAPSLSYFQSTGVLLRAAGDWVSNVVALLAWCLGALMYYYVFYQARLIPRWLSVWGLIGIMLTLGACMLVLFRLLNPGSTIQTALFLPIALQEMVLAVWLIIKGFNPSALRPG